MKKKKDEITIRSSIAEYLTYVASVGDQQDSIEMRYEDENIWLTRKMMAILYDVDVCTINEHIKKIYSESEQEMRSLEHLVSGYLDLAEDYAERHIPVTMEEWAKHLDSFLMRDDRE